MEENNNTGSISAVPTDPDPIQTGSLSPDTVVSTGSTDSDSIILQSAPPDPGLSMT
jgi:hypothetical protein